MSSLAVPYRSNITILILSFSRSAVVMPLSDVYAANVRAVAFSTPAYNRPRDHFRTIDSKPLAPLDT